MDMEMEYRIQLINAGTDRAGLLGGKQDTGVVDGANTDAEL